MDDQERCTSVSKTIYLLASSVGPSPPYCDMLSKGPVIAVCLNLSCFPVDGSREAPGPPQMDKRSPTELTIKVCVFSLWVWHF